VESNLEQKTAPEWQPTESLSTKWTEMILTRLHGIFGKPWADHIAGVPHSALRQSWADGLAGLTAPQIRAGLNHVTLNCKWPPSIAEFRTACLPPPEPVKDPAHCMYLPPPPRTREARAAALEALHALKAKLPRVPEAPPPSVPAEPIPPPDRRSFIARRADELAKAGLARFAKDEDPPA
jgi:hypothetical protein